MNESRRLTFFRRYGPVAVVTGASSGIGRAIATDLAGMGFDLLLVARNSEPMETLAEELRGEGSHGRTVDVLAADLSTPEGIQAVFDSTREKDVGLLVAAAGFGTAGSFLSSDLPQEQNMLAVNCAAPMIMSRHFGTRFAHRGRGGIILFGSLVGYQGTPRAAHYAATKAYIQTFAEGLHHEFKSRGVDVLASAPGPVRSGFAVRSRMQMGGADRPEQVSRDTLAALGHRMTVTPGPLSKFLTASLMTAPRALRVRIMGLIMGGMTRDLD